MLLLLLFVVVVVEAATLSATPDGRVPLLGVRAILSPEGSRQTVEFTSRGLWRPVFEHSSTVFRRVHLGGDELVCFCCRRF